ncbi:hypothetical protein ACO34A_06455 [Rhizobium sp. ACO-34A]|nr:manganese efflux pump MntP family protein [Rhizobium sp. ACO-34A]ATN33446.1 hypothetical protein ACO34A_06455 [Rhizobium sp. ACO-34A]
MSPAAVFFLSVSMSVDAFAVSVSRGTALERPRLIEALKTGAVFGAVEAMTPFLGWMAGVAANEWVAQFDHWIAFGILMAVGLHMVYGVLRGEEEGSVRPASQSLWVLIATAFGTSIDAMAVSLSLALIDVGLTGIIAISLAIGLATLAMSTSGLLLGKAIGDRFGKFAEIGAGVVLCSLGSMILYEHMTA